MQCTSYSLNKPWNSTSIEQDLFLTRHCIPTYSIFPTLPVTPVLTIEYISVLSITTLFLTIHTFLLVRKVAKSPGFMKLPGFVLVCLELGAFGCHALNHALLLTGTVPWLFPVVEGIGWSCVMWWLSCMTYYVIMLLDGINMENGAIRGEEKVTRQIWKALAVRLYLDTLINLTLLSTASYFKYTSQLLPNVLCCSTVLCTTVLLLAHNAHIFSTKSEALLRILRQCIEQNAQIGATEPGSMGEKKDVKLRGTYERLRVVLPMGSLYFGVSMGFTLGTAVYGVVTVGSEQGMMWSSPITAFLQTLVILASFCTINTIFVNWWLLLYT